MPELIDSIVNIVHNESNNNPAPKSCFITKVYDDNIHIDAELLDGNKLTYVKTIGNPSEEEDGIVIFTDGEEGEKLVIPQGSEIYAKFGLNEENADRFNYAVISRIEGEITNIELWILANAEYDYENKKFVKINKESNSFGIQIQAEGNYPNESEIGYLDNTSIGVWRHPKTSAIYRDTTNYDYTDLDEKNWIGCTRKSDDAWLEFGVSAGWNNNFMMDAFGGMTIGGAGFEIDGNGIYPFTRITHSIATINGVQYALVGILDNAYHSLSGCDDNSTYSWFTGLKTPVTNNRKDNSNTSFVVMYNNTTASDSHTIDNNQWNIVFEVNKDGVTQ